MQNHRKNFWERLSGTFLLFIPADGQRLIMALVKKRVLSWPGKMRMGRT